VLSGQLHARTVVVGQDFHFGHGRRGDVALLARMGQELGFEVEGIELMSVGGELPVSSTRIRQLLAEGRVEEAASALGRDHQVRGRVERGDGRGRSLGFPTANVAVPADICLPADGIYAGWFLRPSGSTLPAAISLGRRPTFYPEGGARLLEAYVLDFNGDLYGEAARVRFADRIRDELRFDSAEDLVAQMHLDVDEVRRVLGGPSRLS